MIHGNWPGLFWVYLIQYVFKTLVFEEFLSHELDLHHFHFVSVQSVQEIRREAPPLCFLFHHMFLISTLEFTSKHTHTLDIWVHHYMFDWKALFFLPISTVMRGRMWDAGAGFKNAQAYRWWVDCRGPQQTRRQVALGSHSRAWVCCCSHKHKEHAQPEPGWITKTMCSWTGLSAPCEQAGNGMFPWGQEPK